MAIMKTSATSERYLEDDYAAMAAYVRSAEGQAKIAQAQAEIDAGEGIVADDEYFETLKIRRAQRIGRPDA